MQIQACEQFVVLLSAKSAFISPRSISGLRLRSSVSFPAKSLAGNLLRVVDSAVVNREPALTVYRVDLDEAPVPENLIVGIIDRALNWGWNHRVDADDGS
jgi:hypothetical protein